MSLYIKPLHGEGRNCFEDSLATVAEFFNREYKLMYLESWNFCYNALDKITDQKLGEMINLNNENQINYFSTHSGILVKFNSNDNEEQTIKEIIYKLLNDEPIIVVGADSFFLPWDPNYTKRHVAHSYLLTGFDELNSNLICTDSYYQKENETLSIEQFLLSYKGVYASFIAEKETYLMYKWSEMLENVLTNLLDRENSFNCFDKIKVFSNHVEEYFDSTRELEGYGSFEATPLYINLGAIIGGRLQFSELLNYFAVNHNIQELNTYSQTFKLMANQWNIIKVLFSKGLILQSNDYIKNKVPDKIREIAEYEEEIAKELLELINDYS